METNNSTLHVLHTAYSHTSFNGKKYLTFTQITLLLTTDALTLVGNLISNFMVLYIIIKTKKIKNTAYKMLFQLSFADFCVALLAQSLYFVAIFFHKKTVYIIEVMQMFFSIFLVHVSCYTIAFLGFDRFLRVKHTVKYSRILSSKRVHIIMASIWLFSLLHAVYTLMSYKLNNSFMHMLNSLIEALVALTICILHIAPAVKMSNIRSNALNPSVLEFTNQSILRLSSRTISLFLAFLGPYVVIVIVYKVYGQNTEGIMRSYMEFLLLLSYQIAMVNSFANAILFLATNTKAKIYLKSNERNRKVVKQNALEDAITRF